MDDVKPRMYYTVGIWYKEWLLAMLEWVHHGEYAPSKLLGPSGLSISQIHNFD